MLEDEPFLRAILANPDDRLTRLVYADWLDDRADPRAEYLRLASRVAELPHTDANRPDLRRQLLERQAGLPPWWVAIVGGLRVTSDADDRMVEARSEAAAQTIGCKRVRTDEKGYEVEICDAAMSGLTGALAYLQCCSKWQDNFCDIHYYLYLRDSAGYSTACEPYTYNPFFGCRPKFLEWYGDVVVFIYEEKHDYYVARFGFNSPAKYVKLADYWTLDGNQLAFIGYREPDVQRLSVPDLKVLPPLTQEKAASCELMPAAPDWWLREV